MLSRFITRSSPHLNRLASSSTSTLKPIISPKTPLPNFFPTTPHFSFFSTNNKNGNVFDDNESPNSTTDLWKLSSTDADQDIDSIFSVDDENIDAHQMDDKMPDPLRAISRKDSSFSRNGVAENEVSWKNSAHQVDDRVSDPFRAVSRKDSSFSRNEVAGNGVSWKNGPQVDDRVSEPFQEGTWQGSSFTGNDTTPWSFAKEEKERSEVEVFGIKEESVGIGESVLPGVQGLVGVEKTENDLELEAQEKVLIAAVKGPDRAFGDLIAASGITDDMLDSLLALKDFEGIEGLPSLSEIEKLRYERTTKDSSRAEIERQKQEAAAKARVKEVDEQGRAYGTGKRKCSIARVWINPGEGKFIINDKEFDVYFPMIDHRAALLRPFSETKTLGLWDVNCTVKGGGTSGQVGAIRLGISRALQNWEPGFRPPLKEAGFLTRDSRIVERKKPGKAKARKSFQWVKR